MILKKLKPPKWVTIFIICLLVSLFLAYIFNIKIPFIIGMLYAWCFIGSTLYLQHIANGEKAYLYEISECIEVHGSKVVIEKLPKYYRYENVNLSRLKRNIFKLDYEDFFEKATLTNENGDVIQISKEDYEFLESINKDSEVK